MKNFKELINELEEKKTMSLAQRRKAAQRMKRMAKTSSFKAKVAKKARKIASPEDLMKRAQKKAKLKLITKMGIDSKKYSSMEPQQKMTIDKKLEKKGATIKKIAKKMLPALKKQEVEKVKKAKAKKEEANPCWDGYKQVGMKTTSDGRKVPNCVPEETQIDEKIEGLKKKSEKSGIAYGILKKVYDRGMAAWRTGHRPGTTPQQWAFARVNSFITGGGARKSDADLWKKHKG
tara:strand:- start:43 stop:741 length:699 start_codon:yes stop_codon:yes gene_type:complete